MRLEERLPVSLLSKEVGVSKDVVYRWVKAYQERGESRLQNLVGSSGSRRRLRRPAQEDLKQVDTFPAGDYVKNSIFHEYTNPFERHQNIRKRGIAYEDMASKHDGSYQITHVSL